MRPNAPTLKLLNKHRTLPLKTEHRSHEKTSVPNLHNGQCIAVYIRRGDKASEMKLQPFSKYVQAIEVIMDRYLNHSKKSHHTIPSRGKPAIFIGSEGTDVLKEAVAWGKKNGYQVSDHIAFVNEDCDYIEEPDRVGILLITFQVKNEYESLQAYVEE